MKAPYGLPVLLALTTLVALVVALLMDGPWDVISWAALAWPIALLAGRLFRPASGRARRQRPS